MSKTDRKNVYLICNAHIDPVWLWEWQEGVASAISTFRVAAELCEKNKTFIFNHNEAILYEWVRQYEPQLFKRIQKLVKAGRWHIMGGWWLQPDCNMPSGESLVRHILVGKKYFKKHFDVEPTTAINFDPFGHSRGLVQILAKSGYDSYLFGRPRQNDCPLPQDNFIWVGFDGSKIMAFRFAWGYNSPLGKAKESIEKKIAETSERNVVAVLWGVGNHGGGPSRKDLKEVNHLIRMVKDVHVKHSCPEEYFAKLSTAKDQLPEYSGDLNPWAVGCYSSQIRIKQMHRLLENELYSAEKMASAAAAANLMPYPHEELDEALKSLLTVQFHDILPGSSIKPVEEASLRLADHGLELVSRIKTRAFYALSSSQKKAKDKEIPILAYNPHPFAIEGIFECEFQPDNINLNDEFSFPNIYQDGKKIPSQAEKEESSIAADWRKRAVFYAKLLPMQMNRFDVKLRVLPEKPLPTIQAINDKLVFQTKDLKVEINCKTGLIDCYDVGTTPLVKPNAFAPLVVEDNEDPWGMRVKGFTKIKGHFQLASPQEAAEFAGVKSPILDPVRVIEDGEVRMVVEALLKYDHSVICQRYKLPKKGTEIEVELFVYWNQKDTMLKLAIPVAHSDIRYIGQTAFGIQELATNGDEMVAQKWTAAISEKDNSAFTCINDGTYGSSFMDGQILLTLLRSPAYSAHPIADRPILPSDRFMPRIDQGERMFRFWFNGGNIDSRLERVDREALAKNERPYLVSFFPSGMGKKPKPLAVLEDDVIQISAIKFAEDNSIIVRLFEPNGKARESVLSMPAISTKFKVHLNAFEVKTLKINRKTKKATEVDLLEQGR